MRMHCFVQNGLLGVLEHSGKCVINEEVVTCPAYCSLFCWSQGKLSEPEGSVWCSKHDLLPCDGNKEQICLPAALCGCCRTDWAVPALSLSHGEFTPLTQFHTRWGEQIPRFQVFSRMAGRETLIADITVGGKYPCEIPYSKPHTVNKISLCISLFHQWFSPILLLSRSWSQKSFIAFLFHLHIKAFRFLGSKEGWIIVLVKHAKVGMSWMSVLRFLGGWGYGMGDAPPQGSSIY